MEFRVANSSKPHDAEDVAVFHPKDIKETTKHVLITTGQRKLYLPVVTDEKVRRGTVRLNRYQRRFAHAVVHAKVNVIASPAIEDMVKRAKISVTRQGYGTPAPSSDSTDIIDAFKVKSGGEMILNRRHSVAVLVSGYRYRVKIEDLINSDGKRVEAGTLQVDSKVTL